jgi:hypothetical protein
MAERHRNASKSGTPSVRYCCHTSENVTLTAGYGLLQDCMWRQHSCKEFSMMAAQVFNSYQQLFWPLDGKHKPAR